MSTEEKQELKKGKSLWGYYMECMVTDKYFRFKGRACRKEFWGFELFKTLITFIAVFFVSGVLGDEASSNKLSHCLTVIFFFPELSVLVRRLHDVNFSAWWAIGLLVLTPISVFLTLANSPYMLFCLIPTIILFIFIVIAIFLKSQLKENKYGSVPEGVE